MNVTSDTAVYGSRFEADGLTVTGASPSMRGSRLLICSSTARFRWVGDRLASLEISLAIGFSMRHHRVMIVDSIAPSPTPP